MKITNPKLRSQTLKLTPAGQRIAHKADSLAETYLKASEAEEEAKAEVSNVREIIFAEADDPLAEVDGNTRILHGLKYKVGKTAVMSAPKLDPDKLRPLLTPSQRKIVFKQVEVEQVDEAMLVSLIESGKLTAATLRKATIPATFKHNRIIVEKLLP